MTDATPSRPPTPDNLDRRFANGELDEVLRLTAERLSTRPGDDSAHELRARALLALGRVADAERHALDAVRLDPDEIRYRELLAEILSRSGAHREAATEYQRLARNDPRLTQWTVAEAEERLGAAQPAMSVEAAQRAVKLDPRNGAAQLALARSLARTGEARGALQAAIAATELLPDDARAREALADARWLSGDDVTAFTEFRALANELHRVDRERVVDKARTLYRQHAWLGGRLLAGIGPVWEIAFRNGWISVA